MKSKALMGVAALIVAWMTALCFMRADSRTGAPDGWVRHSRGQPFVSQSVLAKSAPIWGTTSLAAYQTIIGSQQGSTISTEVWIPESGKLVIAPHFRVQGAMDVLVIETGSPPSGKKLGTAGAGRSLPCTGSPTETQPGWTSISLERATNGWSATINGESLACASGDGVGSPALTAGLRRVSVRTLTLDGRTTGGSSPSALGLAALVGSLSLAGLLALARWWPVAGVSTAVGMLSGLLIIGMDGAQLAETLRLLDSSEDWLPLWLSGFCAVLGGVLCGCIQLARKRGFIWTLGPSLAFALGTGVAWGVIGGMGWLYTVFAGLSLGALVWVNVHPTRLKYYNLSALGLAAALLGSTEVMVRYTHMGSLWNAADVYRGAGSITTLIEQFEGMKSAVPSIYPAKGFPVALPPKRASKRIVCLGASSTGGAFQNDSLDEFYPARLAQLQATNSEVVNQGVGGWTSFHIRQFLDGYADKIDGDVWTIYLGVNENLPTPMPFADLYEAWKNDSLSEGIAALDKIRLYQALRLFARSFRPGGGVGVPPESLRDNLRHIVGLAQARGVKVMLMSEGVRPDPRILWHYSVVMKEVAEESGADVHYIDVAERLDEVGDRAFIDSNHLTDLGHRTVANLMASELTTLGWW